MDYLPWGLAGGLLVIGYFWYANIIAKRNKAREALSSIDVQMKQRLDLIPNILKIAQRFMEHERSLLSEITALRTKVQQAYNERDQEAVKEHLGAARELSGRMGQLMIQVENYPDLKSNQTMLQAMQTYNETEAQISAARRFYNAAVTALNNAVQIFPGNFIARIAGVTAMPFFEAEDAIRTPVDAGHYLS